MKKFFKKSVSIILASLIALSVLSACNIGSKEELFMTKDFIAMDTYITLKFSRDGFDEEGKKILLEEEYINEVMAECEAIATELDAELSAHDEKSLISEINTETDRFFDVDSDIISFLLQTIEISGTLDGKFDPTIGAVTLLWNINGEDARVPNDEELTEALSHVGCEKIEISGSDIIKHDKKVKLDLGAIAKGYALKKITEYIATTDIVRGLINFGGSVSVIGEKANGSDYKIGITDPKDNSSVIGYVYIDSGFVSVSGNYERYAEIDGVRYDHIFDPETGRPADTDLTSVAVLCDDPVWADALSTALYVMGSEKALEFSRTSSVLFEAVFTTESGDIIYTDGIKATDETTDESDTAEYTEFEKYIPETTDETD